MRAILFAGLILSLAGIAQAEERILEWAPVELPSDRPEVSVGAMSLLPFISRDPSPKSAEESTFKTQDEFIKGNSLNIRKRPKEELLRQKQQELKKLQKEVEDLHVEVNWQQQLVITVRCLEVENSKIRLAPLTPLIADPVALHQNGKRYRAGQRSHGSVIDAKTLQALELFLVQSNASELLNEKRTLQSGAAANFSVGAIAESTGFVPWYLRGQRIDSQELKRIPDDVPVRYGLRIEPKKLLLGEVLLDFESPITNRRNDNSVETIECGSLCLWEARWIETSDALLVSGIPSGSSETQVIWVVKFQRVLRPVDLESVTAELIVESSTDEPISIGEPTSGRELISFGFFGVSR